MPSLNPQQEGARRFAFSGGATLADIPSLLAQLAAQGQDPQNILLALQGGEGGPAKRGGGVNPLVNQFGLPSGGGGGGGAGGVAGTAGGLSAAQAASDPGFGEFGGGGGVGSEGGPGPGLGGNLGLSAPDLGSTSPVGLGLGLFGGGVLGAVPGLLSELLGPVGVVGGIPNPQVLTPEFAATTGAGEVARSINTADFLGSPSIDPFSGFEGTTFSGTEREEGGFGELGGTGRGGGGPASAGSSGADSEGGGFGCFAAWTLILMGDFSKKPISEIRAGDRVMSFDENGIQSARVIGTMSRWNAEVVGLSDGTICTPDHRFLSREGEFKPVIELDGGIQWDGTKAPFLIVAEPTKQVVYNFTVERLHTYIANGWRVHNIKDMGGLISEARVPGVTGGHVPETLQEGEFVVRREAVNALGPEFLKRLNMTRRLSDLPMVPPRRPGGRR